MKKTPKDLMCHRCFDNPADYLLYFTKSHPNGKSSILQPVLLCKQCADNQLMTNELFNSRPVLLSFNRIALSDMPKVMWLCSFKGKECNDMGNKTWRSKLYRIKKYAEGRRQSPVMWFPCAI